MLAYLQRLYNKEVINDFETKALNNIFKMKIDHMTDIKFYILDNYFLNCSIEFKINEHILYTDKNFFLNQESIEHLLMSLNEDVKKFKKLIKKNKFNLKNYTQQGLSKMCFYNKMGQFYEVIGLEELDMLSGDFTSVNEMCDFISSMDMDDTELYVNRMFA